MYRTNGQSDSPSQLVQVRCRHIDQAIPSLYGMTHVQVVQNQVWGLKPPTSTTPGTYRPPGSGLPAESFAAAPTYLSAPMILSSDHQFVSQKMSEAAPNTLIAPSAFDVLQAPQDVQRSILLALNTRELVICGRVRLSGLSQSLSPRVPH